MLTAINLNQIEKIVEKNINSNKDLDNDKRNCLCLHNSDDTCGVCRVVRTSLRNNKFFLAILILNSFYGNCHKILR